MTELVKIGKIKAMKLSTKSTYGLRAMLNIALETENGAISTLDISKREGISVTYLEQLLNKLRHKGLVESVRGPKGGYILSKSPDEITVADIVNSLEENMTTAHCVTIHKGTNRICKRENGCVPKLVWVKLAKAISDCLESMTLGDLAGEAQRMDVGIKKRRLS